MMKKIRTINRYLLHPVLVCLVCLLPSAVIAKEKGQGKYQRFVLGLGVGLASFTTNAKFTDKQTGRSIFVDAEGTLNLPKRDTVPTIMGIYRFGKKHAILFNYFQIDRQGTLFSEEINLGPVNVSGKATITDKTRFYDLKYGYTFHEDERSRVLGLIGLYGLDFRYTLDASGQISVGNITEQREIKEGVDLFAPIPVIGVDFAMRFTRKWGVATRISLVGGKYQDVTAGIVDTMVYAKYKFNQRLSGLVGITYFDADVKIEDSTERTDIIYGYSGLFLGLDIRL